MNHQLINQWILYKWAKSHPHSDIEKYASLIYTYS